VPPNYLEIQLFMADKGKYVAFFDIDNTLYSSTLGVSEGV
jgi:hypothetical protein